MSLYVVQSTDRGTCAMGVNEGAHVNPYTGLTDVHVHVFSDDILYSKH